MKIGLILFGIPRSLKWTSKSIAENIIRPFEAIGEVETYGHLNFADIVRSRESRDTHGIPALNLSGLNLQKIVIEDQRRHDLEGYGQLIREHDLASTENRQSHAQTNINFIRGLESLRLAWDVCEKDAREIDLYIFARSDLYYRDEWPAHEIVEKVRGKEFDILVPDWHHWGGINDRFAVANARAAELYARRIEMLSAVTRPGYPMNSESILARIMEIQRIKVGTFEAAAQRVRSNGSILRDGHPIDLGFVWKRLLWRYFHWLS